MSNKFDIWKSKFVQGWAKFGPSVPMEEKISTLMALFGVDEAGWLRIPEVLGGCQAVRALQDDMAGEGSAMPHPGCLLACGCQMAWG